MKGGGKREKCETQNKKKLPVVICFFKVLIVCFCFTLYAYMYQIPVFLYFYF